MPTDTERREVARRLRELPDDSTYPDLIGAIADHEGWYAAADAAERLADLIEPDESGQNRDRNQDSVQKESPIVQIEHGCDRDALLALAEEMQGELDECADDHEIAGKLQYWVDRIREACGEDRP